MWPFTKTFDITIYLKGGQTVVLNKVKSFKTTRQADNDLSKLEWEFKDQKKILYIRLDDISMIVSN